MLYSCLPSHDADMSTVYYFVLSDPVHRNIKHTECSPFDRHVIIIDLPLVVQATTHASTQISKVANHFQNMTCIVHYRKTFQSKIQHKK